MAAPARKRKGKRQLRYFFINVDKVPHCNKVLHLNRAQDIITVWDFPDHKRKQYNFSDIRKNMQNGYTIAEVAEILGVHVVTIRRYYLGGRIQKPYRIYNLENNNPSKHIFSEDDVLDLHLAMSEVGVGRPRADGLMARNRSVADRATVLALVQRAQVLYTLDKDGNPIPLWKEQVW